MVHDSRAREHFEQARVIDWSVRAVLRVFVLALVPHARGGERVEVRRAGQLRHRPADPLKRHSDHHPSWLGDVRDRPVVVPVDERGHSTAVCVDDCSARRGPHAGYAHVDVGAWPVSGRQGDGFRRGVEYQGDDVAGFVRVPPCTADGLHRWANFG